jgi:uncharacterized repeat protein (TIGR03803 family)
MKNRLNSIRARLAALFDDKTATGQKNGWRPVQTRLVGGMCIVALALSAIEAKAVVVFTTLHSFRSFANGQEPFESLVQGTDGYFYGATDGGGISGAGTLFKISSGGVLTTLYAFSGPDDGAYPNQLMQSSDGYFYGTAYSGGTSNQGTVFRLSANGVLTTLYNFTGGNNGGNPEAGLIQGKDGFFYGTTYSGGSSNLGTVFRISTNGVLTGLHSFTGGNDGSSPSDNLVQGDDGFFYGTTYSGSTNNDGVIFKISTNGALISLHSFTGGNDGANCQAALIQGSDGYLYGTTYAGSTNNNGTVFKISTNGVLTTLYTFTGGNDGANPAGGLVQGSDGNFYGTTVFGGTNDLGTLFRIGTNGVLTALYSFTGNDDGLEPGFTLVQGSDGYLYGTTDRGGADSEGNVFKSSTNGALTGLYSFNGDVNEGGSPAAPLVRGSDGYFYGTAPVGGAIELYNPGPGTVFKISPAGALATLYNFTGGNDGGSPYAALVQGNDGYFYGTTESGGTNDWGTVFKISTNGDLTTLYSFTGGIDGGNPEAALVLNNDGYFYGTTYGSYASSLDHGTVYRFSTNGTLTTLHSFAGGSDGANPGCVLVPDTLGNFYGTTSAGGGSNQGTVFRISLAGTLTNLYSFTGSNDGANPFPGVVWGNDGYLYGTTSSGGTSNSGTIYRISTQGALTTLYSFTGGSDGEAPNGLIRGSDGNFYGTTYGLGLYNDFAAYGTVFRVNPARELTTLYSFNGWQNGSTPQAGLVETGDGNFYGTTSFGGAGSSGTVFRFALAPVLSVSQTNGTLELTWSTDKGWNYQLQYSTDLISSNWINLGPLLNAAGTSLGAVDSIANGPGRFYRVLLSP